MSTFNPYRRIVFIILAIALFVTVVGMACDDTQPCADACGLTAPIQQDSPLDELQGILQGESPDNTLSGGN